MSAHLVRAHGHNQSKEVKNYILDTNVLLHDPNSLLNFEDNSVIIPIEVLEEIDRFKRESTELGQNARTVSRMLDSFRAQGHLSDGVNLPNGGRLQILVGKLDAASTPFRNSVDSRIVLVALQVRDQQPGTPTILVTKDINLRIKADTLGLAAEDYETDRVLLKDLYSGMCEKMVSTEKMTAFRANGELEIGNGRIN